MSAGAPVGNSNAARGALVRAALKAALDEKTRELQQDALLVITRQWVVAAMDESVPVVERLPIWKELADRLDGKPKQQTEVTGADGGPIVTQALQLDFSGRKLPSET